MTDAHREWARGGQIRVLRPDYSAPMGPIPDYQSLSTTYQCRGIGTGTIMCAEEGPALQLLAAQQDVVPVVIDWNDPHLPRWSGRVAAATGEAEGGEDGTITATLMDDTMWLRKILAIPSPTLPIDQQTVATHDVRSGPLETVAKAYIAANATRLGAPLAVVPPPAVDTSPAVRLEARFVPLADLLEPVLALHGYDVTCVLWLPGDDQPRGLVLTQPTIVVDVYRGRDRHYVRFADDTAGLIKRSLGVEHTKAAATVVLGPGEELARVVRKVPATDGRVARQGKWAFPEDVLEATDAAANLTQRGQERNAENAGLASIAAEVDDDEPWQAGPRADFWIGDTVRAILHGVPYADQIDRFTVTDNADQRMATTPQFGRSSTTASADVRVLRAVAAVRSELARNRR